MPIGFPSISGAATDLGVTTAPTFNMGNQLSSQVNDELLQRKKKALQLQQQRQMFPASGMLLSLGNTAGSM